MVTHLVCQCGNEITSPEVVAGEEFRCSRCGRLLRIASSTPPPLGLDDETFAFLPGHDEAAIDATPAIEYWAAEHAGDEVRAGNDEIVTQITTAFQTGVFDPGETQIKNGDGANDLDFVVHVDPSVQNAPPAPDANDDETKIAEAVSALPSRQDSSSHRRDGSRATSLDLSERVMDTTPGRPSLPITPADDSGAYGIHRVLRTHQKGGMGKILIAYDLYLKRDVALKELHPEVMEDDSIVRRFIGEAEITAQLEHPGIVPIHTLNLDRNGNPYYTMKLIKGHTFQDAIKAYHRNPSRQELLHLVRRLVSICKTMAFAHNKGVIHRDLKPANIMLGEHGETLVMDWGLAKPYNQEEHGSKYTAVAIEHRAEQRPDLTMVGAIVGTPAFMSPEQAMPEDHVVGPLADVFSLGTILYYLLAGQTAFSGRSTQEVLKKVRAASPPRPSEIKPNVPAGLEAICAKAMAKAPEDRYQSAGEMDRDLCRWLDGEPVHAQTGTLPQKVWHWIDRHRVVAILTPLLVVLLVALTALGIQFDRFRVERNVGVQVQSILEEPVDLTDQPLISVEGGAGVTVLREPRQTGGSLITCRVENVAESFHGLIEMDAPEGCFWNLSRRATLNFSLFESYAEKAATLPEFFVRLGRGSAYYEFRPTPDFWSRRKRSNWFPFAVPLAGSSSNWTRTEADGVQPSMDRIEWIEFHFVTKEPMTIQIDHVYFQGDGQKSEK